MRILISESEDYSSKALADLRRYGEVNCSQLTYTQLYSCIQDYEVLVVRLGVHLDSDLLAKARNLRYILSPTTGLDHIDLIKADELGIRVISLKGQQDFLNSIPSTGEHSFALLLSLLRNIPKAHQHVVSGGWNRQILRGHNLRGMSIGILGMGRVGYQVAGFARAFGMTVLTYDPNSNYLEPWMDQRPTAESLMTDSKILSIHIPMNPVNQGFVSKDLLSKLPKGAYIINTSRGGVWDEEEVAGLLEAGKVSGVATDVLADEQAPDLRQKSSLIRLAQQGKNVIITPHIAGATYESMHMTEEFVVRKWIDQMKGLIE